MNKTLAIWNRMTRLPAGRWIFTRIICFKAPYFSSISPQIDELKPGLCTLRMRKRRAVQNHLGTVHAIAMCNMAELTGGMVTEVTIPTTHRWIPAGMTVQYVRKAKTDLTASARPLHPLTADTFLNEGLWPVWVEVSDTAGTVVFTAEIRMQVSRKADSTHTTTK